LTRLPQRLSSSATRPQLQCDRTHTDQQEGSANLAAGPVREMVSAAHHVTDLTLGLSEVVLDYLQDT
jgi:acetoacetate decarboxylase